MNSYGFVADSFIFLIALDFIIFLSDDHHIDQIKYTKILSFYTINYILFIIYLI